MKVDSTKFSEQTQYIITSYCKITPTSLNASNISSLIPSGLSDFSDFTKDLYNQLKIDYPKFFKMDNLSKLAFLTTEVLLKNKDLAKYPKDQIGVVIANSYATLDTDNHFYQTINDKNNYFPSPSLFVYTLPNIMIGEICIRHKIMGENAFFVFKEFNHNFINNYVIDLLNTKKISSCITGWIDYTENKFESMLFLVESLSQEENQIPYTQENTKIIYSA